MTPQEAKREYDRKYREVNREKINANHRKWAKENKDKVKQHIKTYWERKAKELEGETE